MQVPLTLDTCLCPFCPDNCLSGILTSLQYGVCALSVLVVSVYHQHQQCLYDLHALVQLDISSGLHTYTNTIFPLLATLLMLVSLAMKAWPALLDVPLWSLA